MKSKDPTDGAQCMPLRFFAECFDHLILLSGVSFWGTWYKTGVSFWGTWYKSGVPFWGTWYKTGASFVHLKCVFVLRRHKRAQCQLLPRTWT